MCPPSPTTREDPIDPRWSEREVVVEVEVPKGGFVKRLGDGSVDFVSPLPCPFNYGAIPDTTAADGDRDDAVLLGRRHPAGTQVPSRARAVVRFVDAGDRDDKLICSDRPLSWSDRARVRVFFAVYARVKGLLQRVRGRSGPTRVEGWVDFAEGRP